VTEAAQQHVVVLVGSRDWESARHAADAYRRVIDSHRDWFRADSTAALNQARALAPWWSHRAALLTTATGTRCARIRQTSGRCPGYRTWPVHSAWAGSARGRTTRSDSSGLAASARRGDAGPSGRWRPPGRRWRRAYVVLPITLSAQSFSARTQRAVVLYLMTRAAPRCEPRLASCADRRVILFGRRRRIRRKWRCR